MKLNSMKPGSRKAPKRRGRGHSAGQGKTCGRGQKGQRARSGGYHKVGFEGGQMPLQRRLPKIGFVSRTASDTDEIRLHELGLVDGDLVDLLSLKKAGLIGKQVSRVRVIKSGELGRAVTVKGLKVTAGARKAISDAGGTVED